MWEGKRAHELEAALQWLKNSGLVYLLELVQHAEAPLSANADATYFKVYMADCGLLCRRLGIGYKEFFSDAESLKTFKGAVTENYVMNELLCAGKRPYFWRSGNTAELDFLFEEDGFVVPVEVKASENLQAKSLKAFHQKWQNEFSVRTSLSDFRRDGWLTNIPLYGVHRIAHVVTELPE